MVSILSLDPCPAAAPGGRVPQCEQGAHLPALQVHQRGGSAWHAAALPWLWFTAAGSSRGSLQLSCSNAGVDVSVASCCIASALASQQLQFCLPPLASALQATEASTKQVDKWLYTGPRRITFRVGPKVLGHRTVSDAAGYVSPEGEAAPLPSPPPSESDSGVVPPPQVSMCPACSAVSSLRTVGVPTASQDTSCYSGVQTWFKLQNLQAVVQYLAPVAHLPTLCWNHFCHAGGAGPPPPCRRAARLDPGLSAGHPSVLTCCGVDLSPGPVLCSCTWRQGPAV